MVKDPRDFSDLRVKLQGQRSKSEVKIMLLVVLIGIMQLKSLVKVDYLSCFFFRSK